MKSSSDYIHLGEISGIFGVKGWVKVFSHTTPRENIVKYKVWQLGSSGDDYVPVKVLNGRQQGKGVVAQLEGVTNPDQARQFIGTKIYINKHQLTRLRKGEYYWSDLEGLAVITTTGVSLGKVAWLFETGNNDVLVVEGERERYIPYIADDVIISVDLQASEMIVAWDPEF
jgi:16S rRNA processing protein RimM